MIPSFLKTTRTRRAIVVGWLLVIGIFTAHILVPYNPDTLLGLTLVTWIFAFVFGDAIVIVGGNLIYYSIRWILTGKGFDL